MGFFFFLLLVFKQKPDQPKQNNVIKYTASCFNISLHHSDFQNQVQNLAIRGQQGATTSSSQTQTPQALTLKQSPVPIQPASLVKNPSQGTQTSTVGKASSSDSHADGAKKSDGPAVTEVRALNMSRNVTAVSAQPLIAPGKRNFLFFPMILKPYRENQ